MESMIHPVSERAENDITLDISNGENESYRQWMGRTGRFEEVMSHFSRTSKIELNLVKFFSSIIELNIVFRE